MGRSALIVGVLSNVLVCATALAQPATPVVFQTDVLTHAQISGGTVSLKNIRDRGLDVFCTPFTTEIGYGDGPINPLDKTSPGGRPTLQGNGTFLRVNGLDGQTCLECHASVSQLTVPFTFGVGGIMGAAANPIFQAKFIDVNDSQNAGEASMDGRFINPPFLFGSGGIELLAKEMTVTLQTLKKQAQNNPGQTVQLVAKGVSFGSIKFANGQFDTSRVEGVDADLVVRPFGRKGEFPTIRAFDVGALRFHFGMEPIEDVGPGDSDGDGVSDEISIGDLDALSIFNTNLDAPRIASQTPETTDGFATFQQIGCAACHIPFMDTETKFLPYTFPEDPTQPFANEYFKADLRQFARFEKAPSTSGLRVRHFSDLKRHEMGPDLAESFGSPLDSQFITARLWGVADTAPYLHDGRAHTIEDAILQHGGEALAARNAFAGLGPTAQQRLVKFLFTLRTPKNPAKDIL